MDTQDILKMLNSLEQSLQNVESARQQVTNTVDAYEGARSQLHALTKEFATVSAELKEVYAAINENIGSMDGTLHRNMKEVFKGIASRAQELENAAKNIQLAFEATCNHSAQSIEGAVDKSVLKLYKGVDATVADFKKKATCEMESIAASLATFKAATQQMQKDFCGTVSETTAKIRATHESIASDFGASISSHISSFESLREELKSIVDRYEEVSNSLAAKVNGVSDLVKDESASIASTVQKLQASQKTEFDGLTAWQKSLHDETVKAVDCSSSLIVNTQKEAIANTEKKLADEIECLKGEVASSKKLAMYCLIAIVVSLILNVIAFLK